jgi:predicted DCC family thiol-disulfide oxidoreductase YuxK
MTIMLFDGICNFCNGSVQWVIRHDQAGVIKFAALQSDAGQKLLAQYLLDKTNIDSVVVIHNDKAYSHSKAAIMLGKQIPGWPKAMSQVFGWLPSWLLDPIYRLFAANRYRLFGKMEQCMLPTKEQRARFL